ncbi:MAG: phosphatidylserine decarboxylase [Halioglobus sp.]
MTHQTSIVQDLEILLENRPDLKSALKQSIVDTKMPEYFSDLQTFYDFIAASVVQIPKNSQAMLQQDLVYFYMLSISPKQILVKDPDFQAWNVRFNDAWGDFLDTDKSSGHLESYINDPQFQVDQYQRGPSGWHSFNQFFARQTKPGLRPLAGGCDSGTIVSPCDFLITKAEKINADSVLVAKQARFTIAELLKDSKYKDAFEDGLYISAFLQIFDYHRFHTPVAGKVLEARNIPGKVGLTIEREGNILVAIPQPGFQFTQDRGLMIIDSPEMGLVALLPVGMAQISSVVITAEVGVELCRGEEFGYFQFGGSNMIMLTQKGRFALDKSIIGNHILQGEKLGEAKPAK